MLFPPVGITLLSVSVIQAIWEEISPEWKELIIKCLQETIIATQKGVEAGVQHLQDNPFDVLGSSVASSNASSGHLINSLQDNLDSLLDN